MCVAGWCCAVVCVECVLLRGVALLVLLRVMCLARDALPGHYICPELRVHQPLRACIKLLHLLMRYCRYEGEQKCEMNKEISMKAIEEASHQKQGVPCFLVCMVVCVCACVCVQLASHDCVCSGFAAVKMSSLGKPELLEHVSACLHAVRRLFRSLSGE